MHRLESQSVRVQRARLDREARVDYPRGESDFYVNTHTQRPAACFVPSSNTEYGPLHSRLGLGTPCISLKSGLDGQTKFRVQSHFGQGPERRRKRFSASTRGGVSSRAQSAALSEWLGFTSGGGLAARAAASQSTLIYSGHAGWPVVVKARVDGVLRHGARGSGAREARMSVGRKGEARRFVRATLGRAASRHPLATERPGLRSGCGGAR